MNIYFVSEGNLTHEQIQQVEGLAHECFGDIAPQEIQEDFIAESFGKVLTYEEDNLVGMLNLFKRTVVFENEEVILGGMGAICVTEFARGQGIATQMMEKGLEILKEQNVDIACLNVDREKEAFKLYEKLGFKFLNRDISFEDINGKIKYDSDSMFIPINSPEKFEKVMNSKTVFHQGKGYW